MYCLVSREVTAHYHHSLIASNLPYVLFCKFLHFGPAPAINLFPADKRRVRRIHTQPGLCVWSPRCWPKKGGASGGTQSRSVSLPVTVAPVLTEGEARLAAHTAHNFAYLLSQRSLESKQGSATHATRGKIFAGSAGSGGSCFGPHNNDRAQGSCPVCPALKTALTRSKGKFPQYYIGKWIIQVVRSRQQENIKEDLTLPYYIQNKYNTSWLQIHFKQNTCTKHLYNLIHLKLMAWIWIGLPIFICLLMAFKRLY